VERTVGLVVERGTERVDGINACRRRFVKNECVKILEEEEGRQGDTRKTQSREHLQENVLVL
jgi:hypothetical protein